MKLKSHTKDQLQEIVPWKWSESDVVRKYDSPEHAEKSKQQLRRNSALYRINYDLVRWDKPKENTNGEEEKP